MRYVSGQSESLLVKQLCGETGAPDGCNSESSLILAMFDANAGCRG